jgi:protein-L-isoaspartate(D-aspartate) O-methyltransferase
VTDDDLASQRRFFAEEVQSVGSLGTAALVEALAGVPRERFLRPGPWLVQGQGDLAGAPRRTPDADPRHVYHNVSVAIDPARHLFNGAPSVVCLCIDALELATGGRVLHVGCGLGYYSALMAQCVGPSGRIVAIEVDAELAGESARNLAAYGWVETRQGDGTDLRDESFDAILVSAGVTHPHESWLRALRPGGRLIVPLTCSLGPAMPAIGKGILLLITETGSGEAYDVRLVTMVAIYSAVGIRDEAMNDRLGKALKRSPFPRISRLRRDPHEPSAACWLHGDRLCFA